MNKLLLLLVFLLANTVTAQSQQLDRLRDRASRLWEERIHRNKLEALKYVEPAGRSLFVQAAEPQVLSAKVVGFEFDAQPDTVTVVVEAHIVVPGSGELKWSSREKWLWDGKNWMLHYEIPSLFSRNTTPDASAVAEEATKPIAFEFTTPVLDPGPLVQGQVAHGALSFKGDKENTLKIQTADFPGLTFGSLQWDSPTEGKLPWDFDSSLVSADVAAPLEFLVFDRSQSKKLTVPMKASIQGQVRFAQNPKPADATKDGRVELQITNLTSSDLKLKRFFVTNPDFQMESDPPDTLPPQGTMTVGLQFKAHKDAVACVVAVRFAGELLKHNDFAVPLQLVHFEKYQPTTYSKEDLKRTPASVPADPALEDLFRRVKKANPMD